MQLTGDTIPPSQPPQIHADVDLHWGRVEAAGFGTLWLRWSERGLRELHFDPPTAPTTMLATLQSVPEEFSQPLARYFSGEATNFEGMRFDLQGTTFQLKVWQALRQIPYGHVRTYGSIAVDIGSPRGMRAVGAANGANPIPVIIPCHRVIAADDKLGGYSGGLDRKRFLLELEGVRVEEDIVQPGQLGLF